MFESGVKLFALYTVSLNVISVQVKWSVLLFSFQEAIKENSVTMNKMRVLKNKMESQKNMKVKK